MKSGRRAPDPANKRLSGTFRRDRHDNIIEIAQPPRNEPVQPGYLSEEARAVWDEELRRVVACGVTEADSSLFARYCVLEAAFRVSALGGEQPQGVIVTELRRLAELLGIAGQRSRLARVSAPEAKDAKPSPFAPRSR